MMSSEYLCTVSTDRLARLLDLSFDLVSSDMTVTTEMSDSEVARLLYDGM